MYCRKEAESKTQEQIELYFSTYHDITSPPDLAPTGKHAFRFSLAICYIGLLTIKFHLIYYILFIYHRTRVIITSEEGDIELFIIQVHKVL